MLLVLKCHFLLSITMSLLASVFNDLSSLNRRAFIPFIMSGDPSLKQSLALAHKLVANGADILEFGVPFSDPMADGVIIQKSHERALINKVSLSDVLNLVAEFRKTNKKTAIVLMGYANPIESFGYKIFAKQAKQSGVDGVLVVDLPIEESQGLKAQLTKQNIDLIFLVSLTTTNARLVQISRQVSGFAYFVALKGVTGATNLDIEELRSGLIRVQKFINIPIGVGFGIKNKEDAKEVAKIADAVIIGSAIVALIEKYSNDNGKMLTEVAKLSKSISKALIVSDNNIN